MKYLTIFAFLILLIPLGFGQSLDMGTISSNGGSSSDNKLNWTQGESFIGGNNKLTQGFHQGLLFITTVYGIDNTFDIAVYPNPTQKGVFIKSNISEKVKLRLYDIHGRILQEKKEIDSKTYVDLSSYQTGLYFIQLFGKTQLLKIFKIEKIN